MDQAKAGVCIAQTLALAPMELESSDSKIWHLTLFSMRSLTNTHTHTQTPWRPAHAAWRAQAQLQLQPPLQLQLQAVGVAVVVKAVLVVVLEEGLRAMALTALTPTAVGLM